MADLDSEVGELFKRQNAVHSEMDYRAQLSRVAEELFERQPPGVDLPVKACLAIVVSLLMDYQFSLEEVGKKLSQAAVFNRKS